jgi:hypothetical protein
VGPVETWKADKVFDGKQGLTIRLVKVDYSMIAQGS